MFFVSTNTLKISSEPKHYNEINLPPPPGRPRQMFVISLMYTKILVFKFEGPITNNKGNKRFAPSP